MEGKDSLAKIREILKKSDHFIIAGHTNPDGDCIGACLGLGMALRKLGKDVTVYLEKYNDKFLVIPGSELVRHGVREEEAAELPERVFVALDCADQARLGEASSLFAKTPVTVCIDHHATNRGLAVYNHIVPAASSTSEVIYNLLREEAAWGVSLLDQDIAAALYGGIVYDTGGFRHGCTSPETYRTAGDLVSMGIDFTTIYNELMYQHSYFETMIFSKALSHLRLAEDCPVAYSYVSGADLDAVGATGQDMDGVVEYLLNIKNIEVAFFVYEKRNSILSELGGRDFHPVKISLRSKEMDVGGVATSLGGGGHHNAAGCNLDDNIDSAIEKILFILRREFVNK